MDQSEIKPLTPMLTSDCSGIYYYPTDEGEIIIEFPNVAQSKVPKQNSKIKNIYHTENFENI